MILILSMSKERRTQQHALSRNPCFYTHSIIVVDWKMSIKVEYTKDGFATNVLEWYMKDIKFRVKEGLILYKNRIYLVPGLKV